MSGWKLLQVPLPPYLVGAEAFGRGSLRVLLNREERNPGGPRLLHLSISHPTRYPTWEEIKAARYDLMPHDVMVAMLLPPPADYVNIHPNCFHLWELRES